MTFRDGSSKPSWSDCRHFCEIGCNVYLSPERPRLCQVYECAWLKGYGRNRDRPDMCGLMVSIADIHGGTFVVAVEARPGAATGSGKRMLLQIAREIPLPIIIGDYMAQPPNDRGNRVAITKKLQPRARAMMGKHLTSLSPDLDIFELNRGSNGGGDGSPIRDAS